MLVIEGHRFHRQTQSVKLRFYYRGIADDDTRHAFQKALRENRKVPVFEALYDLVNGQEKLC